MITSQMIKELREATGVGMMDCKKALTETDGNIEEAKDWLRKKGLAKAAKKADRVTASGLVAVKLEDGKGTVVEINSETDFVAKNDKFQAFVKEILDCAFDKEGDVEAVREEKSELITSNIASIGENLQVRRAKCIKAEIVGGYVHSAVVEGMGGIGVLVGINGVSKKDEAPEVAKKIAMHIAAASPQFTNIESVDASAVEREKAIFSEQAAASGKPAEIIEKMVVGRVRKFYEEVVLEEQSYVMDPNSKVKDIVKTLGADAKICCFEKFVIGEGIEKVEDNLADEVAKTLA